MIDLPRFEKVNFMTEIFNKVVSGEDIQIIDLNEVNRLANSLVTAMNFAHPYISIKANSSINVLGIFDKSPYCFDAATIEEVSLCEACGIAPERILFSHPAKDKIEVQSAYRSGVRQYCTDSLEDLNIIAENAPGSQIFVRIKAIQEDSEIVGSVFNDRFGVDSEDAIILLARSTEIGLTPYGITFHVGSQQEKVDAWDTSIRASSYIFKKMQNSGIQLNCLNIGGGFPARYKDDIPLISEYGAEIKRSIHTHFDGFIPNKVIYEPGRSISAMAGWTIGRVINVKDSPISNKAVVTVSTGRFSAGIWDCGNGISFFRMGQDGLFQGLNKADKRLANIYGKACATLDKPLDNDLCIPNDLRSGDIIVFTGTGAYCAEMTTNWCSKTNPTRIFIDGKVDSSIENHLHSLIPQN